MASKNFAARRKRTRTLDGVGEESRLRSQYVDDHRNDQMVAAATGAAAAAAAAMRNSSSTGGIGMQNPFMDEFMASSNNDILTSDSLRDTLLMDMDGPGQQPMFLGSNNVNSSTSNVSVINSSAGPSQQLVDLDDSAVEFVNSVNYTSAKKVKKQRTVSLPQLPHARLIYESRSSDRKTQNDDELLHVSGTTTQTVDGNKIIKLPVIRSVSPSPLTDYRSGVVKNNNGSVGVGSIGSMGGMNRNDLAFNATRRVSKSPSKFSSILKKTPLRSGMQDKPPVIESFQTDKEGHYVYQENDIFAKNRFQALQLLGQGTFGKVVKCRDYLNDITVAVKIIRAVDRYRQAAKTELRVLQTIKENDRLGQYQCLLLREFFDYKNHICLVTDLYGRSVYDFMTNNGYARFPGSHVQAIGKQLVRSVCFLHDLGIIHTDLKPENILICDETCVEQQLRKQILDTLTERRKRASGGKRKILINPEVKLIDFGSAVFHNEYHPPVVSTRHYRAPEIVLGLGWSFPCDIWSIACVLVELVTGESLYPIHENLEHMAMMQRINNESFPKKMVDKMFFKVENKYGNIPTDLQATVVKYFDRETGQLQWPVRNSKGNIVTKDKSWKRVMTSCDRLDAFISKKLQMDYGPWLEIHWNMDYESNWNLICSKNHDERNIDKNVFSFWYQFVNLCRRMFEFDPTKRITAQEVIEHEWFNIGILDEGITHYGRL